MLEAAILVVFPLCMAIAAMTDILSMTIPNRVSLVLAGYLGAFLTIRFQPWPKMLVILG